MQLNIRFRHFRLFLERSWLRYKDDNVASTFDPDVTLKNTLYTGGKLLPDHSEFKKVLARRRSRKSTRVPNVVDFDHVGNDVNAMNYLVDKSNLV